MKKDVLLNMKTTYGKDSILEHEVRFFTEAAMEKFNDSYVYTYDETNLYDEEGEVTGQLEVGKNFVVRTIASDVAYVLRFEKGNLQEMPAIHGPGGFVAEVETLDLDIELEDGIGSVHMFYNVYLEDDNKILTEYELDIKEVE